MRPDHWEFDYINHEEGYHLKYRVIIVMIIEGLKREWSLYYNNIQRQVLHCSIDYEVVDVPFSY